LEALPELAQVRTENPTNRYYPLTSAVFEALARESPCVPRRILSAATRAFEEVQKRPNVARPSPEEFLSSELEQRRKHLQGSLQVSDTPRIITRAAQVIAELEQARIVDRDPEQADFVLEGARRAAVSLRNEADGRSLGPKLKALLAHVPRKDGAAVAIVRDPRLPIAKTAVKAREHLTELRKRGAVLIEPSIEALAALEALASILGDAKSGDLANEGEAVAPNAVLHWLRELHGQLQLEPIEELMESMLGDAEEPGNGDERDLAELLSAEHVVVLEIAAEKLNRPSERLLQIARKASGRCLVLEGPPTLLLDIAGVPAEVGETQ
jgi:hypothetical protein